VQDVQPADMKKIDHKAYWARYSDETFVLQRMPDKFVFLREPHPASNFPTTPCEVIELPLKASDPAFVRAMEKILRKVSAKEMRSLASTARKLPYYRDIKIDSGFRRNTTAQYNLLASQGATIHLKVSMPGLYRESLADHDCLKIEARWKGETAHLEEMPADSDPIVVAQHLRQAFDIASKHPRWPFRFGTDIWVYRVDDQYFFEDMRHVRRYPHGEGLHRLPVKASDEKLGAKLFDAISRSPRLSDEELGREAAHELHWRMEIRSVRASLFWDGLRSPRKLSFAIVQADASLEKIVTVPVNAKAQTIGKMVRTVMAAKLGSKKRGLSNEALFDRLDRVGFFDLCKRKAGVRRKFLEQGWNALIDDSIHRVFMADSEDLAEGGVGDFLREAKPFFDSIGLKPGKVRDESRDESYDVWIDGKCFPILIPDDFDKKDTAHLWGIATYRASIVLNLLLKRHGRKELAYSMSGGNEHSFVFITPEMHSLLERGRGYEKRSGPYRSTADAPFYGMIEY
jgi:hypothetical protein